MALVWEDLCAPGHYLVDACRLLDALQTRGHEVLTLDSTHRIEAAKFQNDAAVVDLGLEQRLLPDSLFFSSWHMLRSEAGREQAAAVRGAHWRAKCEALDIMVHLGFPLQGALSLSLFPTEDGSPDTVTIAAFLRAIMDAGRGNELAFVTSNTVDFEAVVMLSDPNIIPMLRRCGVVTGKRWKGLEAILVSTVGTLTKYNQSDLNVIHGYIKGLKRLRAWRKAEESWSLVLERTFAIRIGSPGRIVSEFLLGNL